MKNSWQAEDDARVLSQAEVIKADKKRMSKAASAAQKMCDEKMKEAEGYKVVAAKKLAKSKIVKKSLYTKE